ncbi:MAG: hypothetical protein ACLFRX_00585 [Gemmatimonadota bacterium]
MAKREQKQIANVLLEDSGRTYAREAGARVERDTPAPLFQTLVVSLLLSARISAAIAVAAAKALFDQGWTTPRKMARSTWERRAQILNEAGYARYDNRTATMLGDTAELLLDRWDGDLRKLREEAGRDPDEVRKLLTEFSGIGEAGAAIFCREVQVAWDELYPFADDKVLEEAGKLRLPTSPGGLADLAPKKDFPRLLAAIIRVALDNRQDEILARARG